MSTKFISGGGKKRETGAHKYRRPIYKSKHNMKWSIIVLMFIITKQLIFHDIESYVHTVSESQRYHKFILRHLVAILYVRVLNELQNRRNSCYITEALPIFQMKMKKMKIYNTIQNRASCKRDTMVREALRS